MSDQGDSGPVDVAHGARALQSHLEILREHAEDLDRVLRMTIAATDELLSVLSARASFAAGLERRLDGPPSVRATSSDSDELLGPEDSTLPADAVPDTDTREANIAVDPVGQSAVPPSSAPSWIQGTIRGVVPSDDGATFWVVPEDQPHTAISVFFGQAQVGADVLDDICASFGVGDEVRVRHTERYGHDVVRL